MKVESIYVGKPVPVPYQGQSLLTGIWKNRVEGRVWLGKTNFEGDGQGDTKHHGGPDKAVCVYPIENYTYWKTTVGLDAGSAAFGENLSVSGWTESDAAIGDIVRVGEAVLQVSQPRIPCYKLGLKHSMPDFPDQVKSSLRTGFYVRVLEEGFMESGAQIELLHKDEAGLTVREANHFLYVAINDAAGAKRVLSVEALATPWREIFTRRLEELARN